ncbi:energy-coupling factor ABC transporter substrate-binding protein [Ruminiclostridium cellobioparum]|jgi:cobalt/nickel transport protein|uniref:Cobalt transport protein CbiN n=1 Tax=Ruminiclostridium cellobioparum subsp. termitidis CT1112 TaxID=1195236 RepID=S0FV48_RUMCE|nr:energy-coupling factor ABC transporter substrate-binding protein [Ruminiclostridium cellobioparum]EMS73044.1 ABC-type cobalt transport system, periplasmic component [Ruminiclostridium cellobioparum subsp. termitidis CT1112]
MKLWKKNVILILVVVLLLAAPPLLMKNAEFAGADGLAEEQILQINPDYEPWFNSLLEPASGEIESLLFALQAAVGAGLVGFVLGRLTGRKTDSGIEG